MRQVSKNNDLVAIRAETGACWHAGCTGKRQRVQHSLTCTSLLSVRTRSQSGQFESDITRSDLL